MNDPMESAHSILSRLSDATGDVAFQNERDPTEEFTAWCKANPTVRDKIGAYADHLFNDPGFNSMMADWIYDYAEDEKEQIAICERLITIGHGSVIDFASKRKFDLQELMARRTKVPA